MKQDRGLEGARPGCNLSLILSVLPQGNSLNCTQGSPALSVEGFPGYSSVSYWYHEFLDYINTFSYRDSRSDGLRRVSSTLQMSVVSIEAQSSWRSAHDTGTRN